MTNTFQLEIITPTQIFTEGQVSYIRAESPDGHFGIMAQHTPAIIALGIGEIKVVKDGKESFYATNGGFADIQSGSVLLLVETAEKDSDIDKDRADSARQRAQERMQDKAMDRARNTAAMARAKTRLKVFNR